MSVSGTCTFDVMFVLSFTLYLSVCAVILRSDRPTLKMYFPQRIIHYYVLL